jgi:hypothetical protein
MSAHPQQSPMHTQWQIGLSLEVKDRERACACAAVSAMKHSYALQ